MQVRGVPGGRHVYKRSGISIAGGLLQPQQSKEIPRTIQCRVGRSHISLLRKYIHCFRYFNTERTLRWGLPLILSISLMV